MGTLRSFFSESDLDSRVYKVIQEIIGRDKFEELKDFLHFYKITAEIIDDRLEIKQFSHKKKKWIKIASFNIKTKNVEKSINRSDFLKLLDEENEYILKSTEEEIKRTANIILALLFLILGAIVSLLLINTIK